jgi:hypothetical protein
LIFNQIGFVLVILGGVLAAVIAWLSGDYMHRVGWMWGLVLVLADLSIRLFRRKTLWRPKDGGWLFWIPVWSWGIALTVLSLINPNWMKAPPSP